MRDIFITAHSMDIGGAEKSLLGILENVDTRIYNIDLFLLRHEGELLKEIPSAINVLPKNNKYSSLGTPLSDVIKNCEFRIAYSRLKGKFKAQKRIKQLSITGDNNIINEYSHKYTVNAMPEMSNKEYDVAVSFMSPHYFVANKVKAKKKIAWIHTDYSTFQVDVESETKMWDMYDQIIAISEAARINFVKTFPKLQSKVSVIENILPYKYIQRLSNRFTVEDEMKEDGSIKLLSIGRFTYPKRFDEVPKMCKIIKNCGLNIKWYLIGFGSDEDLITSKIAEAGMEKYVINLGKKENPYPYIKSCDFYIQPSRYEGKSIAVREAQAFSKPVIITNYSTAHSQLNDGIDGVIVPLETEDAAKGIASFIKDKNKQEEIINNTKKTDYIGISEIEKINSLFG